MKEAERQAYSDFFLESNSFFPPKAAAAAIKKLIPPSIGIVQGGGQHGGGPIGGPGGPIPALLSIAIKIKNAKKKIITAIFRCMFCILWDN
ncbi:MAG TPA: hypothetical protein VII99_00450 [Bacteroidia bacterium]